MSSTPTQALEPCPFCGGEGLPYRVTSGWRVSCKNCDAQPRPGFPPDTELQAIAAWNQRHRQSSNAAGVDWVFVRECVEEARSDHVGYHESNMPGEPDTSKYDATLAALASLSTPTAEPIADALREAAKRALTILERNLHRQTEKCDDAVSILRRALSATPPAQEDASHD